MFDSIRKNLFQNIRNFVVSENLLWFIVLCGIVLYLRRYFFNHSIWLDEARVSLCIIKLPISAFLHQPLGCYQAAPFGFLVIEKLIVTFCGPWEYALRFYPEVSGLISLWIFYRLVKIYIKSEFSAFALFAFVITPTLVWFSSEVKPYYTDIFFVLISYLVIAQTCLGTLSWRKVAWVSLLGMVMIWCSFPVIFILSGIIATCFLTIFSQRNWSNFWKVCVISFSWCISFILSWLVLLRNIIHVFGDWDLWTGGFLSFRDMNSWARIFNKMLCYPCGFSAYTWLAGLLFFIGGYSFFKEDKKKFFLLLIPLLFVFLASGLRKYSAQDRLVLFLVPVFMLMIAKGVEEISLRTKRWKLITAFLLMVVLFYSSFFATYKEFISSQAYTETRPLISYLKENMHKGDAIFVYYGAVDEFEYYRILWNFSPDHYFEELWPGVYNHSKWTDGLEGLRHYSNRVWVLFANFWCIPGNEKDLRVQYLLKSGGKVLEEHLGIGIHGDGLYLFDLTNFSETAISGSSSPVKAGEGICLGLIF